ncbi:DUF3027 domain-containing protein [Psychromicrobium xiongbiense]|uniref:DUF3027 domain-containing protein n=1 Tax=Psychromicrobium xiongbiense TaxID=3051184 RepID=UPI002557C660|nr:DUF3027 domain-containing protein [Psychromicrobium sp. YIM S02556]
MSEAPDVRAEAQGSGTRSGSQRGKYGVPVWRVGKPDAVISQAVDVARNALLSIAKDAQIGAHLGAKSEGERVATHLFECKLPGYVGWQWFAVLTRVSRSKHVTVDEVGLLPSDHSLVAPEWLPWSERVRPEDAQTEDALAEDSSEGSAPEELEPSADHEPDVLSAHDTADESDL